MANNVLNKRMFAYPEFIKENIIYAEDVQEAIVQLLVKSGLDEEELRQSYFEFQDPETGKFVTTQVLKIRWR